MRNLLGRAAALTVVILVFQSTLVLSQKHRPRSGRNENSPALQRWDSSAIHSLSPRSGPQKLRRLSPTSRASFLFVREPSPKGLGYYHSSAPPTFEAKSSTFASQKAQPPEFKQYPADVYAGKPAPLNLRSHRLARMYRTSIREQLHEQGINFAGHYTIAVMGCGTGCSITAIVDARNGSAYFPRELDGWNVEPGVYEFADNEDVSTFRADSRLLKIIGAPRLSAADERWGPGGIYYYEWKNNRLRQVQFVRTKHAETRR